uniref:Uncharacterized protein n=1 Tax=Malurus cyaneus samueli TaxID=2593467 RepID=A0A8C5U895_9PASS
PKINLSLTECKAKVVIPSGDSTPVATHQNLGLIIKIVEEFVSESLEHVTSGDKIFGCLAHEILVIEPGCVCPAWSFWLPEAAVEKPLTEAFFSEDVPRETPARCTLQSLYMYDSNEFEPWLHLSNL